MLTKQSEEKVKAMPRIKSTLRRSKDGRYLVHQTTITDVKAVPYYETIIAKANES